MALIYRIFEGRKSRQASVSEVRNFLELGGNVQVTGIGTDIYDEIAKDFPHPGYIVGVHRNLPGGGVDVFLSKAPSEKNVYSQAADEESVMNK